ncbi:MAG: glycoside hydrolase family 88 protein [Chitinispirillaceae bacterium]|nr:glycoside hydrolase family 88 protein [Chitinispirillaceae bacterium]
MNYSMIIPAIVLVCISFSSTPASQTSWAVDFSNGIIQRWPNSINDMTAKGWEYTNAIVLQGIERTWAYTKNAAYLAYIKKYVDQFVNASGNVAFDSTAQSLDKLHPAILCLLLYQETGEQKYKIAADKLFSHLKQQPTNPSGGFWHKKTNANHMLLDGIYMAHPFLAKYGYQIGERNYCDSMAAFQILLLSSHVYVHSKKLLLHGWDESKTAAWADKTTGLSSEIWSRATGWFSMALVEVLRYFPKEHPKYPELLALLNNLAEGIKNTQDPATGLWYQVVDKGSSAGNWLESSGSGMMVCALKNAVDHGFIDRSYLAVAQKGWTGLKTKFTRDNQSLPVINDFVGSMNVLVDYAAYVSQVAVDCPPAAHTHGYCGSLMAAAAMELSTKPKYRLSITSTGQGSVTNPTGEMFHDSGTTVTLTAVPAGGYQLSQWSGDASGSALTATIVMNGEKTLTATFVNNASATIPAVSTVKEGACLISTGSLARITLLLGAPRKVAISLFNFRGIKVADIDAGFLTAGTHSLSLDSRGMGSGTYFFRVQTGAQVYSLPFAVINRN